MTSLSRLAELHIRQFAAQQKRQDELSRHDCLIGQNRCAKRTQETQRWRQIAINSAGPLCLLDAVGQAEESWLELLEHAPRCELPQSHSPTDKAWSPRRLGALTA
ncbi:hypothetical protein [Halochromatium roseum]|uniref:hypothetical protein n=1 Tax=Halochromatium roseum TaxID=391920 RepID=UPI00191244BF|nr:hypothetical protein [Halochromatium roseum]MBK5939582.1 hypothetical protein [Halochromatium roseum]